MLEIAEPSRKRNGALKIKSEGISGRASTYNLVDLQNLIIPSKFKDYDAYPNIQRITDTNNPIWINRILGIKSGAKVISRLDDYNIILMMIVTDDTDDNSKWLYSAAKCGDKVKLFLSTNDCKGNSWRPGNYTRCIDPDWKVANRCSLMVDAIFWRTLQNILKESI